LTIRICPLFFLLVITVKPLGAQLCQGSLGDPVVKIDFGAGSNPGPSLSFPTSYGFVSGDCPNDGFYTVRNNTTACFGDSWHSLTKDHTGNTNGYFMLVNASVSPGDFYVDTVRRLCSKTTFEFAAWVVNVLKPSACQGNGEKPDLTFSIETTTGDTLQTFNSGKINADGSPQWKQYGFFFQTPVGVSDVVVRIRNNAPGGCGNDLALDDITFRPCGPAVTVNIENEGQINIKDICDYNSKSYILHGSISEGFTNPAYQWQFSADNINWSDITGAISTSYERKPTPIGTYYYRMAVAEAENISSLNCRILSNVIQFNVEGRPVTTAGSSSPACEGSTLTLHATGGSTYAWTGPNNFTASTDQPAINNVAQSAQGKYYVTVTTAAGCVQNDSTNVTIVPKPAANAGNDIGICEGNTTILTGSGGDTYTWAPSTGLSNTNVANPLASPADSTVYTLTVKDNASGCTDVDSVAVFVYRYPTANAGADKIIIEGESTTIEGSVSGTAIIFSWLPNIYIENANDLSTLVFPPRDTTYTLRVISEAGCGTATDNVFIKVYKKVIVPNAFSPNKDGINDTWNIPALAAYPSAAFTVFNRFGQPVFTSKGSYTAWNGKYNGSDLPVGTYYYVIDVKVSGLPLIKGWVTLLR
jgi:gliding motility-associated-like protein